MSAVGQIPTQPSMIRLIVAPFAWTIAVALIYAGLALMLAMADGRAPRAATTEHVVTDRHTGLALYGFDPVAYFTEGGPRTGQPDFEFAHAGVTWRFISEGNRDAFAAHPTVYAPAFGGHDPVAVAEGLPVTGHPSVWAVHGNRLFVFHSEANRARFLAEAGALGARAEASWPRVIRTLAP